MENKKTRLLILSGTPGLYGNNNPYNGGGWVASLERELLNKHKNDLELGLAWPADNKLEEKMGGVEYYGIPRIRRLIINPLHKKKQYLSYISGVINIFRPDVILCFGTENGLALVNTITDIPVILHIQGLLNPVFETWMPSGLTWGKYNAGNISHIYTYQCLKIQMKWEIEAMKSCRYFLGRTDWDRQISHLISPRAKYHYCSEMLRPAIYDSKTTWNLVRKEGPIRIVSVISGSPYKGGDVVLRSAKLIKTYYKNDFVWQIYGVNKKSMRLWEKLTGINSEDVNVEVCGVIDAKGLIDVLTSSDVCVHPSYIENSSNTVCEMQLLGCPIIATDVGGISTLIHSGETGVLVPANHPWSMATQIVNLATNKEKASYIGGNARKIALERHNPERIINDLMDAINHVLNISAKE